MENVLSLGHEAEIIDNLKSDGISKMKAEEKLFKKYSYFMILGENKYALSKDDLFDAYADTILAVINSIGNGCFRNGSSLKTFTYRIYHNKCVDLIRKKATRKNTIHKTISIQDMQDYLSDNVVSIIEKLVIKSDLENMKRNINNLGKNYQEVLLLSADGYSDKEIASMTKLKTASVVKTYRLRSLKTLREMVCRS